MLPVSSARPMFEMAMPSRSITYGVILVHTPARLSSTLTPRGFGGAPGNVTAPETVTTGGVATAAAIAGSAGTISTGEAEMTGAAAAPVPEASPAGALTTLYRPQARCTLPPPLTRTLFRSQRSMNASKSVLPEPPIVMLTAGWVEAGVSASGRPRPLYDNDRPGGRIPPRSHCKTPPVIE